MFSIMYCHRAEIVRLITPDEHLKSINILLTDTIVM